VRVLQEEKAVLIIPGYFIDSVRAFGRKASIVSNLHSKYTPSAPFPYIGKQEKLMTRYILSSGDI
jgi:hypothetical protein